MKIEIEIPDWCDERNIVILAGIEQVAVRLAHDKIWKVKTERCNKCGKCCQGIMVSGFVPLTENGDCAHLKPDGDKFVCELGAMRPYQCCWTDPVLTGNHIDYCSIRYK